MTFWIVITTLAALTALTLARALLRPRSDEEPAAAYDLRVYRQQLREVDRDVARGVLNEQDAERTRTEISRRLLAADAQVQAASGATPKGRRASFVISGAIALILIGVSLALYNTLGAPGFGDLSLKHRLTLSEEMRQNRPDQARAEEGQPPAAAPQQSDSYQELVAQLRKAVAERPDDLQGLTLLARNEATLGNFKAAYRAQQQLIALKGDAAESQDYANLADMLILAAGGYVSPEAEAALRAALERDQSHAPSRYYWGLMRLQTGRPDLTFRIWDRLLREGPANAPWIAPIRQQMPDVAARAGQHRYEMPISPPPAPALPPVQDSTNAPEPTPAPDPAPAPESARGPSAADIEAAGDLTAQERAEMVRAMVEGLSDRLATEGGTAQDWARLIAALAVLGETERAKSIVTNAKQAFAHAPEALVVINEQAQKSGLLP